MSRAAALHRRGDEPSRGVHTPDRCPQPRHWPAHEPAAERRLVDVSIDEVLRAHRGVAHRHDLLRVASRGRIDHELRRGSLVAPFRRALCRPWDADLPDVRERAALISVGAPAVLDHVNALRRWRLLPEHLLSEHLRHDGVHVSVPKSRSPRHQPGLVTHRLTQLPVIARIDGVAVASRPDAIISAFALLPAADRRAPAITAVRRRELRPEALQAALRRRPRQAHRAELVSLVELLAAGCESELEIWGCLHVFDHPELRHARRQRRLAVRGEVFRLDLAYDVERVAVELDGDRYHGGREQRERDRRRDALLASAGWLTLRFTFARLTTDAVGCRRDTLATLAARRPR